MGIPSIGLSWGRRSLTFLLVGLLSFSLGCAKPIEPTPLIESSSPAPHQLSSGLMEVSPPEVIQVLGRLSDAYTPQVRILSPRPEAVIENTEVSVRFQVRGLPIYKDEQWQLGPHLHVFLDDQPYKAVYDLSEPLVLTGLTPGTHTLRVFASRPWHESFKTQGAFDQRTFHVFARTPQRGLPGNQPLLTYSRPQGAYGAEPIMLDFYLTNAPLHAIAQADSRDDIPDWRIRCTVNGESFVFDQWQPVYLKGFKPGQNWVQLELIDETGAVIPSPFNNTVRIIDFQPGGADTLSQLMRGELAAKQAASLIDPDYEPPAEPAAPEAEASQESEPLTATDSTPSPPAESKAGELPSGELPSETAPETLPEIPESENSVPAQPAPATTLEPDKSPTPEPVTPKSAVPEPEQPVTPAESALKAEEDPDEASSDSAATPAGSEDKATQLPVSKADRPEEVDSEQSLDQSAAATDSDRDQSPAIAPEPLESLPSQEKVQPLPEIVEPYTPEPDLEIPIEPQSAEP